MKEHTMKKMVGVSFFISAAMVAVAGNVTCPFDDGNIADASAWGGTLPGTDDNLVFSNGTYTLSADCTFGSVSMNGSYGGSVTFDFRDGDKTLKLTKSVTYNVNNSIFHYPYYVDNATTTLRGGTWDCSGREFHIVPLGNDSHTGYTFLMTDGCVITNIMQNGDTTFAKRINNMKLKVCGGARLYTGKTRLLDSLGTIALEVFGGGLLHFSNHCYTDYNTSSRPAVHSMVDCHGVGSTLSFKTLYLGYYSCGNEVAVSDSATMTAGTVNVNYNPTASNNWLRVMDGAEASLSGVTMRYGYGGILVSNANMSASADVKCASEADKPAHGHRLEFLDGADVSVGGEFYSAQFDNHVLVRNASLSFDSATQSWMGGYAASSNCSFTISGAAASVSHPSSVRIIGSAGVGNRLVVEGGAKYPASAASETIAVQGKGCVCRVTGPGTVFDCRTEGGGLKHLMVNPEPSSGTISPCTNNVVEVLDGAEVRADRMFVHGVSTRLTISNATVSACSEENGGTSGYGLWLGRGGGGSCRLILQGSSPAVRCPKIGTGERPMILQGATTIRWEIPSVGYAVGYAAIEADSLNVATQNAAIEVDCSEWAAVKGEPQTELVLLRLTGRDFTTAAVNWFNSQSLSLPDNVSCFIRGREIVLRRKSGLGFALIIR